MALNQECHNCGHVQLVALIENGRSGFPDPHAKCERCKRKGTFYYPSPLRPDDPVLQMLAEAHAGVRNPNRIGECDE